MSESKSESSRSGQNEPPLLTDAELAAAFEDGTIAKEVWDHRAHLRVAFHWLSEQPLSAALPRIRAALKNYLQAQGIVETATLGYHETMTQFWMRMVAAMMQGHAAEKPKQGRAWDSNAFLEQNPFLLQKSLWRAFYTRRQIVSMQAKAELVPPDLTPLPDIDEDAISGRLPAVPSTPRGKVQQTSPR